MGDFFLCKQIHAVTTVLSKATKVKPNAVHNIGKRLNQETDNIHLFRTTFVFGHFFKNNYLVVLVGLNKSDSLMYGSKQLYITALHWNAL